MGLGPFAAARSIYLLLLGHLLVALETGKTRQNAHGWQVQPQVNSLFALVLVFRQFILFAWQELILFSKRHLQCGQA